MRKIFALNHLYDQIVRDTLCVSELPDLLHEYAVRHCEGARNKRIMRNAKEALTGGEAIRIDNDLSYQIVSLDFLEPDFPVQPRR